MSLRPREALLPPRAPERAPAMDEALTWPKLEARLANMQALIESNQRQLSGINDAIVTLADGVRNLQERLAMPMLPAGPLPPARP